MGQLDMTKYALFISAFVFLSWLGLFIHNFIESVDGSTIIVGLVSLAIFLDWWVNTRTRRLATRILLSIGLLQLVGAAVTVLPFSFLPFKPQQTLTHYLAHLLYGVFQVPLIVGLLRKPKNSCLENVLGRSTIDGEICRKKQRPFCASSVTIYC